jgi:hypothetical protein
MRNARLASLALVGAVAFPSAAQASAYEPPPIIKEIANGCYGAIVVVCDVNVTHVPVQLVDHTYPVCAINCTYAVVPLPKLDPDHSVCVGWTNQSGTPTEICTPS